MTLETALARGRAGRTPRPPIEGFDSMELHVRSRPIPGTSQVQETVIRCRPGTFEWFYGRAKPGTLREVLYHAGNDFGLLWESAGLDGPGTVDWARVGVVKWRGLPEARIEALDAVRSMSQELGKMVTARLVHYIAQGKTSGQIASIYGFKDREMSAILEADLCSAAQFFKYRS